MKLTINGEKRDAPDGGYCVNNLLKDMKVANPEMVSVQLNGAFVDRRNFDSAALKDGDAVDFLYFMGGGSP